MSLVLPGNARELRFMMPDDPEEEPSPGPLGQPRVRRSRIDKPAWSLFSPWPNGDWNASARERRRARIQQRRPKQAEPITGAPERPTLRAKLADLAAQWAPQPIPNFRMTEPKVETPTAPRTSTDRRVSLGMWLAASILVAFVSYEAATHVLARIDANVVTAVR